MEDVINAAVSLVTNLCTSTLHIKNDSTFSLKACVDALQEYACGDKPNQDMKKASPKLRLPKLRADKKLTVGDVPNGVDDEFTKSRWATLGNIAQIVNNNVSVEHFRTSLSGMLLNFQTMKESIADIDCRVAFMNFMLIPENQTAMQERFMRIRRFLATDLTRALCNMSTNEDTSGNREKIANILILLVLTEFAEGSFKSSADWKKPTFRAATPEARYCFLNYMIALWENDLETVIKLLVAPVVKFLTGKPLNMADPIPSMDILTDFEEDENPPFLETLLTIRAFGLLYASYEIFKLFRYSPDFDEKVLNANPARSEISAPSYPKWSNTAETTSAIEQDLLPVLQYLIESGKIRPTHCIDSDGRNLIIAAVSSGKMEIVNYILAKVNPPININAKSTSGNTALHVAVSQNNLEMAQLLLEAGGALVDVVNSTCNGATPLHMAAMFGYSEMVDLLIQHSANVKLTTTNGSMTAAQLAHQSEHFELRDQLIQQAEVDQQKPTNMSSFLTSQAAVEEMRRNCDSALMAPDEESGKSKKRWRNRTKIQE